MRVLIVDDDVELAGLLQLALRRAGYDTEAVYDGRQALLRLASSPVDLVVLDVNLPSLDGYQVLAQLRRSSDVPVLMLTVRGAEEDEVRGLDLGADDYLRKPFSPRTLLARLRALLRRGSDGDSGSPVELGPLCIDAERSEACIYGGEPFKLSALEFRLLRLLGQHAPRAVDTERILAHVWANRDAVDREALKQLVHRLRSKLDHSGGEGRWIEYVAPTGYAFHPRAGPQPPS